MNLGAGDGREGAAITNRILSINANRRQHPYKDYPVYAFRLFGYSCSGSSYYYWLHTIHRRFGICRGTQSHCLSRHDGYANTICTVHEWNKKSKDQHNREHQTMMSWALYVYLIQKGEKINFLNNHTIIWNRRVFLSNFLCSSFASFIDARYWPASRKEQNNDICNVSVCLCVSVSLCERECIRVHEQTIINHEESSNCVQGFIEVCVQTPSRK